jgi:hypothetical protein
MEAAKMRQLRLPVIARALLLAFFAVGLFLGTSSAATPSPGPACGAAIDTDLVLQQDLTCTGDGLIVAAPVTIDLNGHTLRGTGGSGRGLFAGWPVTVKNGTITAFDQGVVVTAGANPTTLSGLTITGNRIGVAGGQYSITTITGSTIADNSGNGFEGSFASLNVQNTSVLRNGGYGAFLMFSGGWSVNQSVLSNNHLDGLYSGDGVGQISNSVASYNGGSGIYIYDGYGRFYPYLATANTAQYNGNWGIAMNVSVPAGTDGGGNVADHNGQPAQCLNIVCASSTPPPGGFDFSPCRTGCKQHITINKDFVPNPASPGPTVDLLLNGVKVAGQVADGGSSGPIGVDSGSYTIDERGASLSRYRGTVICSGETTPSPLPHTITVVKGAQLICTIANTRL